MNSHHNNNRSCYPRQAIANAREVGSFGVAQRVLTKHSPSKKYQRWCIAALYAVLILPKTAFAAQADLSSAQARTVAGRHAAFIAADKFADAWNQLSAALQRQCSEPLFERIMRRWATENGAQTELKPKRVLSPSHGLSGWLVPVEWEGVIRLKNPYALLYHKVPNGTTVIVYPQTVIWVRKEHSRLVVANIVGMGLPPDARTMTTAEKAAWKTAAVYFEAFHNQDVRQTLNLLSSLRRKETEEGIPNGKKIPLFLWPPNLTFIKELYVAIPLVRNHAAATVSVCVVKTKVDASKSDEVSGDIVHIPVTLVLEGTVWRVDRTRGPVLDSILSAFFQGGGGYHVVYPSQAHSPIR